MQYFPIFLKLHNQPVLVVGGGEVACRKVEALVKAGADVTIVSPTIKSELLARVDNGECHWHKLFYSSVLLERRYVQVWATTDNPTLNHQVYTDAKKLGVLANVVDDKPYCDFITPSMVNRGRIQIAISSGGAAPVLIRQIREAVESVLPQNLAILADFADSKRNAIKEALPSVDARRKFWERFFAHRDISDAQNNRILERIYQSTLSEPVNEHGSCTWIKCSNDVEMLPIKALRFMQQAELVFYFEGCPSGYLELVRRDADRAEFKSAAWLVDSLEVARRDGKRICVFIPNTSVEYNWLNQDDRVL